MRRPIGSETQMSTNGARNVFSWDPSTTVFVRADNVVTRTVTLNQTFGGETWQRLLRYNVLDELIEITAPVKI